MSKQQLESVIEAVQKNLIWNEPIKDKIPKEASDFWRTILLALMNERERLDADGNEVISLARLSELAEAEREGRVVVLPCKIGDTLYIPNLKKNGFTHDHVCEQKVDDVIVSVCDKQGYGFDVFSEGDYVECYTDRAEAARALAEKGEATT